MLPTQPIKDNQIRENLDWKDGTSLADLLGAVSNRVPNCFISDQLLGHFVNYYYLSERWTTESVFADYDFARIQQYPNISVLVLDEFPEAPVPLSQKRTCLGSDSKEGCSITSPWSHYMDDKAMLRIDAEVKAAGSAFHNQHRFRGLCDASLWVSPRVAAGFSSSFQKSHVYGMTREYRGSSRLSCP
jgi:hypothetical protein